MLDTDNHEVVRELLFKLIAADREEEVVGCSQGNWTVGPRGFVETPG